MNSLNPSEYTFGQWRQAAKSFEIIYPKELFDWDTPDSTGAIVDDLRNIKVDTDFVTTPRLLVISHRPDKDKQDPQAFTMLNVIRVVHNLKGHRLGAVTTWMNTVDTQRPALDVFDIDTFMLHAQEEKSALLGLTLIERPDFQDMPANMSVLELGKRQGTDPEHSQNVVKALVNATEVITSLSVVFAEEMNGFVDL